MKHMETGGGQALRTRPLLRAIAALFCAAILQPAGCWLERSPVPRPNFILIVVDALRADRLHFAGHGTAHSPNFDALQRQSVWFSRAYSTAPWTIPSVASLFVSQLPSRHRVVKWGSKLAPEQRTLVEALREAGYRTGGWTANLLMSKDRGLDQGFDRYTLVTHPGLRPDTTPGSEFSAAPASEVTRAALQWLRRVNDSDREAPFFAYLHYLEPHTPYLCPNRSGESCRAKERDLTDRLLKRRWDFDDGERDFIRSLYDTDVARMDAALGVLVRALEEAGLLENTWLILTANHGEHLGEGGAYVHGTTLDQPLVHVPLLVRSPSRRGSVADEPVSLADVAPTILDIAGVASPDSFTGRSLRPALEGRPLRARPVVAELLQSGPKPDPVHRHRVTVIDGTDVLLLARDGKLQRFDLSRDPARRSPLPASMKELDERLSASGVDLRESYELSADDAEIAPEMLRYLKALGYVQ